MGKEAALFTPRPRAENSACICLQSGIRFKISISEANHHGQQTTSKGVDSIPYHGALVRPLDRRAEASAAPLNRRIHHSLDTDHFFGPCAAV